MSLIRLKYEFQDTKEAEEFYENVYKKAENNRVHMKWDYPIIHVELSQDQHFWKDVIQALIHVFILFRLPKLARNILKENYYYENEDEINHIIPILQSIMKNPLSYGTQTERKTVQQFYAILEENLKNESYISFPSYFEQREWEFYPDLVDITGYAIDEWKREEDYQEYVHILRNYIKNKESKLNRLFITYDQDFQLYQDNGKHLSHQDLKTLLVNETLHFIDLFALDFQMSAIISIAPMEIHLFTNNPFDPKIVTLQNLYQENAFLYPIKKFPFVRKKA